MKRTVFVLLAACALVLATASAAYANFGPHGGYTKDTDSCAGCHRAHTSFSTLGWTDQQGEPRTSALLVSDASNMTDFCYACHGDGAPGASTNVQMGIFDSGPTAGSVGTTSTNPPTTTWAVSNSSYDATLNGGGFDQLGAHASSTVMSAHDMNRAVDNTGSVGVRWGMLDPASGNSVNTAMSAFTCTSCHDPHGSSNYRLLKDRVNEVTVGGYDGSNVPSPTVLSNEEGYPTGGFRKGDGGHDDIVSYVPNYTAEQIRWKSTSENVSTWCSACHTAYSQQDSEFNYEAAESWVTSSGAPASGTVGNKMRHRHPVNIPLTVGTAADGDRALNVKTLVDSGLPLDMEAGISGASHLGTTQYWDDKGYIGCLTCHRAHGSEATMDGWAVAKLATTTVGAAPIRVTPGDTDLAGSFTNPLGVTPSYSQNILRFDNRGVCERCHDK